MRRALTTLALALALLAPLAPTAAPAAEEGGPIKLLIITGDQVGAHDWKATTAALKDILSGGAFAVDVTTTPSKDLTAENLAKYDVLLLNYKDTPQGSEDTRWSDANKQAFLDAVRGGKGLVVYHYASAAFTKPNWDEFEKAILGGWRTQGFHGPPHEFKVKRAGEHPITAGLPETFDHVADELYQNSLLPEGATVIATAYSVPDKPRGTGKDEAVVWVGQFGKGRVYNNALGHDAKALSDPALQALIRRGAEWAATGKVAATAGK